MHMFLSTVSARLPMRTMFPRNFSLLIFRGSIEAGVSNLLVSLGHPGRVVLGHTLNTLQHVIAKKISSCVK